MLTEEEQDEAEKNRSSSNSSDTKEETNSVRGGVGMHSPPVLRKLAQVVDVSDTAKRQNCDLKRN